jgi:hypothetical protein
VVVIAGLAAGITAWLTHGFRSQATVQDRQAGVFSVRAGDCLNLATAGTQVRAVPCTGSHDAEVFGTFRLAEPSWPGTAAVRELAASGCASRLAGYLNPQLATANLAQSYVYPGQQAWQAGERTVVCEVRAIRGTVTGSVRSGGLAGWSVRPS